MDIEDIEAEANKNTEPSGRSLRQSRRLAQIKIKEDAEQGEEEKKKIIKKIVVERDSKSKSQKKKSKDKEFKPELNKKKSKVPEIPSEESGEDSKESSRDKRRKPKKQNLRKLFAMADPWKSSTDSSSHEEEEEEEVEEYVSEEERKDPLKSDHEFSPESDIEEPAEVQPLRRARTVKKESDTEEPADDHSCQKCGKSDHPEWILLCDKCDCGWHCSCLRPALLVIPEGEWFCPPCQHIALIESLKVELLEYDKKANRLELEVRRKERLAYVGISLGNVLGTKEQKLEKKKMGESDESSDSSSGSSDSESDSDDSDEPIYQLRQRRQAHSYRFNDYDDLINSAIQVSNFYVLLVPCNQINTVSPSI